MDGNDPVDVDEEASAPCRTFPVEHDERCSVVIPQAAADVLECPPLELPELLYDAVDVDAVDALFRPEGEASDDSPFVSFEYCGLVVSVTPGRVVVSQHSPVSLPVDSVEGR
jgi:hypothetical protein